MKTLKFSKLVYSIWNLERRTGRNEFSLPEITWNQENPFYYKLQHPAFSKQSENTYFSPNMVSACLHNLVEKRKKPTISRRKIQGKYYYTLTPETRKTLCQAHENYILNQFKSY